MKDYKSLIFGLMSLVSIGVSGQNPLVQDSFKSKIVFPLEQDIITPNKLYKFNISIPHNYSKADTITYYYENDTIPDRKRTAIKLYDSSGLEIYERNEGIDGIQKISWSYGEEDHKLYTMIKNDYHNGEEIYESKEEYSYDEEGNNILWVDTVYLGKRHTMTKTTTTKRKYDNKNRLKREEECIFSSGNREKKTTIIYAYPSNVKVEKKVIEEIYEKGKLESKNNFK